MLDNTLLILTAIFTILFGYHIPTMSPGNNTHLTIGIIISLIGLISIMRLIFNFLM
jgi:hypothetical protein